MSDGSKPSIYVAHFRSIPGEYHIYFCPDTQRVLKVYCQSTKEWLDDKKWKRSLTLLKFRAYEPNRDRVHGDTYVTADCYVITVPRPVTYQVDHWQVRRMKTLENIQTAITFAQI